MPVIPGTSRKGELSSIEGAKALHHLSKAHHTTQEVTVEAVGKERAWAMAAEELQEFLKVTLSVSPLLRRLRCPALDQKIACFIQREPACIQTSRMRRFP